MKDFFKKFNIPEDDFEKTSLKWKDLENIRSNYESFVPELDAPAKYLVDIFHKVTDVHSVRYRIKNPDKLLAKIIRKKIKDPSRLITLKNYQTEITDLIGIRILHLFKEDWKSIHNFIIDNWELQEEPIAYYREGDSEEYIKEFENLKCKVERHPYGYRSVHYLLKTKPNKTTYIAEIQVRTIFEEAWSEIDHTIRYPYQLNKPILDQFLVLFNRLAGSADEMGSFVSRLKQQLMLNEQEFEASIAKKIQIIEELKQEINELKLKPKQVSAFDTKLDEILQNPDFTSPLIKFDPNHFEYPDFTKVFYPKESNKESNIVKIKGIDIDITKIIDGVINNYNKNKKQK